MRWTKGGERERKKKCRGINGRNSKGQEREERRDRGWKGGRQGKGVIEEKEGGGVKKRKRIKEEAEKMQKRDKAGEKKGKSDMKHQFQLPIDPSISGTSRS